MIKYKYEEGTAFLVPLRDNGYAVGVVARMDPTKWVLLGYFFGPRVTCESEVQLESLRPKESILCVKFGAVGLRNGSWKILCKIPSWDRSAWPMPLHALRDPIGSRGTLGVQYADDNPQTLVKQFPIDDDPSLPADGLFGFGAVEITLTKLLRESLSQA